MKLFEPLVHEGYEWVNACNDDDYEVFWSFDGRPRRSGWKPIRVQRVPADERSRCLRSDFPWLGSHALVVRSTAAKALEDLWLAHGELLPLVDVGGADLFAFNARALDAIDETRSKILRFPGSTQIMEIQQYAFSPDVVGEADIFRLPHRASPTFLSERFVDRVHAAKWRALTSTSCGTLRLARSTTEPSGRCAAWTLMDLIESAPAGSLFAQSEAHRTVNGSVAYGQDKTRHALLGGGFPMSARLGIYEPIGAEHHELCHPLDGGAFERIASEVDGTPRLASWRPPRMELIREDETGKLLPSDSPWLGSHALMFAPSAINALRRTLQQYGELLPLAGVVDVMMYNPLRVLDALDETASSVVRFDDGQIMWIQKHVFRPEIVGDIDIFKIRGLRVSSTYVSHRFVDQWLAGGLRGLDFNHVWAPPN